MVSSKHCATPTAGSTNSYSTQPRPSELLAIREGKSERSIRMTLSVAFISPVLAQAAMVGRLPRGFCVKRLTDLPMLWSEQWRAVGLQQPIPAQAALNLTNTKPWLRPHLVVRETEFCGLRLAGDFTERGRTVGIRFADRDTPRYRTEIARVFVYEETASVCRELWRTPVTTAALPGWEKYRERRQNRPVLPVNAARNRRIFKGLPIGLPTRLNRERNRRKQGTYSPGTESEPKRVSSTRRVTFV